MKQTEIKKLPDTVTVLDIIKTFAVITMVIDHIGLYFFEGVDVFRAIGRVGVPIWFFLVGYANTRAIPNNLLIGALVLAVADFVLVDRVFPMSALVTIIFLRFTIDKIIPYAFVSLYVFCLMCIVSLFAYMATDMVFEYGTMAILLAILGYVVRHEEEVEASISFWNARMTIGFAVFVWFGWVLMQNAKFGFDTLNLLMMAAISGGTMAILMGIKRWNAPNIGDGVVKDVLQLCGRKTLEIYVAHLLLFKVIIIAFLALN